MVNPSTGTPGRKRAFLTVLSETCNASLACAAINQPRRTVYNWRNADPEFAQDWAAARAMGADAIEDELVRRAVEGIEVPVYHRGAIVGAVRRYNDRLLMVLLKALKPERYRERVAMRKRCQQSTARPFPDLGDPQALTALAALLSCES